MFCFITRIHISKRIKDIFPRNIKTSSTNSFLPVENGKRAVFSGVSGSHYVKRKKVSNIPHRYKQFLCLLLNLKKKPYAENQFTSTVSLEIKTKAPNYSEFCNAVDSNLN